LNAKEYRIKIYDEDILLQVSKMTKEKKIILLGVFALILALVRRFRFKKRMRQDDYSIPCD